MRPNENELTDYVYHDEINSEEEDLSNSVFACCHLYYKCSNEKRCLCDDEVRAYQCAYRKNLDNGNIFFGRNAQGFDEVQYQEFVKRIDSLSNEARQAFDKLITEFCGIHRGKDAVIVRNEYIEELSLVGLFEFKKLGADFVRKCLYSTLEKQLEKVSVDGFTAYQVEKTVYKANHKGSGVEKRFFSLWMNGPGVMVRDELAEPYRLASAKHGSKQFLEELWQRYYLPVWRHRDWWLTPLAVDGLLPLVSLRAELQRIVAIVKLGCSDSEEKEISDLLKAGNVVSKRTNFM